VTLPFALCSSHVTPFEKAIFGRPLTPNWNGSYLLRIVDSEWILDAESIYWIAAMFSTASTSSPSNITYVFRAIHRSIALIAHAAALLIIGTQGAVAQTTTQPQPSATQGAADDFPKWDFLVASGTLVPTGAQRGDIKRANLTASELLYVFRPELAFTATLGWTRSGNFAAHGAGMVCSYAIRMGACLAINVVVAEWLI
jgi:hypothetical protein